MLNARPLVNMMLVLGSTKLIATTKMRIQSCKSTIHDRLRPSRPSQGSLTLSSNGAHKKFSAYTAKTEPKKPMAVRLSPLSCSQAVMAEPINTQGNPLMHPSPKIISKRLSRYSPSSSLIVDVCIT